jgi:hypothetical protein
MCTFFTLELNLFSCLTTTCFFEMTLHLNSEKRLSESSIRTVKSGLKNSISLVGTMDHAKTYPLLDSVTPTGAEHSLLRFADGSERILDERDVVWQGKRLSGRPQLGNYGVVWPETLVDVDGIPVAFDMGADEAFELSTPVASDQ